MDYITLFQQVRQDSGRLALKTKIKSLSFRRICIRKEVIRLGRINSHLHHKELENKKELILKNDYIMGSIRYEDSRETRNHHIAYGLLRGKAYLSMERACKVPPIPEEILTIIHSFCGYYQKKEWTLERVRECLKTDVTNL